MWCSLPQSETHAAAGARGGAIARDILLPDVRKVAGGAGDRDPIANFRRTGLQLLSRNRGQRLSVVTLTRIEHAAVERLVHGEMAQAAGGEDADALISRGRLHAVPNCASELVAAARARLVGRE